MYLWSCPPPPPPTPQAQLVSKSLFPPFADIPMMLVSFSPRCTPLSVTVQFLIVMFLQQMGGLSVASAGALAHQDISHASRLQGTQEG